MVRSSNGWSECIYCGEMLKPEDENPYSDYCEFCELWLKLTHLAIIRIFKNEKFLKDSDNDKAKANWSEKLETYREIHLKLIEVLNLKKKLYGECY